MRPPSRPCADNGKTPTLISAPFFAALLPEAHLPIADVRIGSLADAGSGVAARPVPLECRFLLVVVTLYVHFIPNSSPIGLIPTRCVARMTSPRRDCFIGYTD